MCSFKGSLVTLVVGCILFAVSILLTFLIVPAVVTSVIKGEVVLTSDTIQYERFEVVPFPLKFSITVFEISNPAEVLRGEIPIMNELGPYVYKLHQSRDISDVGDDILKYRRIENFEFDAEASYPRKEEDMVTIINIAYHAIGQIASKIHTNMVPALNIALREVFGKHNSPIMTVKVKELLFDGIRVCDKPGYYGLIVCLLIQTIGADTQNLERQEDGSLLFSLLNYKNNRPSDEYEVYRGLKDSDQLGLIRKFNGLPHFDYWVKDNGKPGVCNMVNGTDSGIFAPFVDREKSIYAINTDICRSVELRYQEDVDVDGIPTARFSANEWFLNNDEGCFCLNMTEGIIRDDGCLLPGAMELYSCVGATLVLSYPHFLYADPRYRNSVLGMTPDEQKHRIFIDIEPNTGTPIRGAKRAQFNIFQRPIHGIPSTYTLRTVLMPIVWIEEGVDIPNNLKEELRTRLLQTLNLLDILLPIVIAICGVVLVAGLVLIGRALWVMKKQNEQTDEISLERDNVSADEIHI